jgi:dihydrofolate reductase
MRTVTYSVACSLDGFIAGPGGSIDWLHFSDDAQKAMAETWASVDAILMGRKTWDFAVAQAGAPEGGDATAVEQAAADRIADQAPPASEGMTTYVFSRTLKGINAPGIQLVSSGAGEFVRDLKHRSGGKIFLMGGGELAQSLIAAGVVDTVELNIHPVLLGSGVPVFRDAGRRVALELIQSRTMEGGCVRSSYRVSNSG